MDAVQEIKEKLDIVEIIRSYILLQPAGKNFKALCPFHKEKTPSFIVSPDRQTWRCFGACNEGGDVISFVMKYENIEFYEALRMLADKAGVELKRLSPASQKEFGVLYDINVSAKDFFVRERSLNSQAQKYLTQRGLAQETIDEFEIGYAPDSADALSLYLVNIGYDVTDIERAGLSFRTERKTYIDRFRGRIVFPLYNTFGKVVGFSCRILPECETAATPKYLNSPETPLFNKSKILYGLHRTKQHIKEVNTAVLVEGQMDFLMLFQDSVHNVVATSGTALTPHHLTVIKKYADDLVISFDSDEAGIAATERAIDMAHALDFTVRVFIPRPYKDVADIVFNHPGTIARSLERESVAALDFYCEKFLKDTSPTSLKNRARAFLEKISFIKSPVEQSRWIRRAAEHTSVPEHALHEELTMLRKTTRTATVPQEQSRISSEELEFESRHEQLSAAIITLSFLHENSMFLIKEFRQYFAPRLEPVLDILEKGRECLPTDHPAHQLFSLLEMKSSLKYTFSDAQMITSEINFLLSELKREFLKSRRVEIQKQIAVTEAAQDTDAVAQLLKEFDDITKLIDNTHNS